MILFFFSDFKYGGSQQIAIKLANKLLELNQDIEVLTLSNKGGLINLLNKKIKVHNLNSKKLTKSFFLSLNFFRKRKINKVFCVQPHIAFFCFILNLIFNLNLKIIARETNTLTFNKYRKKTIRLLLEIFIKKQIYRKFETVIFSSKNLANEYKCNKTIIPNFVEKIKIEKLKIKKLKNTKIFKKKFLLAVGRLIDQKRFEDVIFAFYKVHKKIQHNLVILGNGPEKYKLKKLINNLKLSARVKIISFDPNPYKYMYRADVFILSSAWEGMPNVLIQALFCNSKIIATDCKHGPREILKNGKYGELVPVGDYESISKKIIMQINKKKKIIPQTHLQKFEINNIIPKFLKLI